MKLLSLVPVYKRPEILRQCINQWPGWVDPVFILSADDPFFKELSDIVCDYSVITNDENKPLTRKMNEGIKAAFEHFDFDLLMSLNSDTLVNPNLIDLLIDNMHTQCIGLRELYFKHRDERRCHYFRYPMNYPLGSGRLITRDAIEQAYPLYLGEQNSGLDGLLANNLAANGIEAQVIETSEPMILDVKSATNLTQHDELLRNQRVKEVSYDRTLRFFY